MWRIITFAGTATSAHMVSEGWGGGGGGRRRREELLCLLVHGEFWEVARGGRLQSGCCHFVVVVDDDCV